ALGHVLAGVGLVLSRLVLTLRGRVLRPGAAVLGRALRVGTACLRIAGVLVLSLRLLLRLGRSLRLRALLAGALTCTLFLARRRLLLGLTLRLGLARLLGTGRAALLRLRFVAALRLLALTFLLTGLLPGGRLLFRFALLWLRLLPGVLLRLSLAFALVRLWLRLPLVLLPAP